MWRIVRHLVHQGCAEPLFSDRAVGWMDTVEVERQVENEEYRVLQPSLSDTRVLLCRIPSRTSTTPGVLGKAPDLRRPRVVRDVGAPTRTALSPCVDTRRALSDGQTHPRYVGPREGGWYRARERREERRGG